MGTGESIQEMCYWLGRFIHVPMPLAIRERYQVDPNGDLWMSVLESTGQPGEFTDRSVQLPRLTPAAASPAEPLVPVNGRAAESRRMQPSWRR